MENYWQESKKILSESGEYILTTGMFCDVEVLVGSEENVELISAHKLILSMRSLIFQRRFQSPWSENGPISVPDISPKAFSKMLKYIYADQISFGDVDEVLELYYAADKYFITNLKHECHKYFESVLLFTDNICRTLEIARIFGIDELEKRCLTYISACTSDVLKSEGFINANQETVKTIFEMNEVTVDSEVEFFHALLSWVRTECSRSNLERNRMNMKKILHPFRPYVFLWTMPIEEFRNAMNCAADIFDCQDTLQIYMNRAYRASTFCINSEIKRIISPDSLVCLDLRKDSCTVSMVRVTDRTVPTPNVYLESCKNNLTVKGIAFHWIKDKEEDSICTQKPTQHFFNIRAYNVNTGVEVNTKFTLTTGTDVKLVFGNFIPVDSGEVVKFVIDIYTDQFGNCVWCAKGNCKTQDFTLF